jgi:hypothetical protein
MRVVAYFALIAKPGWKWWCTEFSSATSQRSMHIQNLKFVWSSLIFRDASESKRHARALSLVTFWSARRFIASIDGAAL